MATIHSRVTLEQIVRKGILTVMVIGFSVAFAYDGFIRYPRKNVEEFVKAENLTVESPPPIHRDVTHRSTSFLARRGEGSAKPRRMSEVIERFGEPAVRTKSNSREIAYYFGPAFMLKLTTFGDVILDVQRKDAKYKGAFDLKVQKALFVILGVLGIPLLYHYVRVLTYSARLTDEGLKLSGKPFVPFEAMMSMDAARYKRKGQIDIAYEKGGSPGTLRLDDYWMKAFRPIVTAICERKGFENPLDAQEADAAAAETSQPGESRHPSDDPSARL